MSLSIGLPYMGSKRKLASRIVDTILQHNPNTKVVYDLFAGGGAVTFEFAKRPQIQKVFYNDINLGAVNLLRKVCSHGVSPNLYQWIDRDTFHKHKSGSDWFSGLVKVFWSFGNGQRNYLYGKKLEPLKKLAHDYLFSKGYDATKKKRLHLMTEFKQIHYINERFDMEHLERLEHLEGIYGNYMDKVEFLSKSYEDVELIGDPSNTIIYLDPPYKNTSSYEFDVDHHKLKNWIHSCNIPVYISGYENDYHSHLIAEFDHVSTLSATNNAKKVKERLFRHTPFDRCCF